MKALTAATHVLRVTNSAAGTLNVSASAVDKTGTGPSSYSFATRGPLIQTITTATTTTIVDGASSTETNIEDCVVTNKHASVSQTITIERFDGTNATDEWKGTLLPSERVELNEVGDWVYYAADGTQKFSAGTGALIAVTVLTSGTTFTTSATTRRIRVRLQGGGGAGAGCTSVAAAASAGGGGGSGGYAEKVFNVQPSTGYTYAIGAAGAGASGAAGGNGGATTFTVGGTTVTANGGQGAPVATAVTTLIAYRGGDGAAVSTGGDVNAAGTPGHMGLIYVAAGAGVSGAGAGSQFGGGGLAITAAGNGNAAKGFGAGGGGALTGASAVRTGGSGTAGVIVVEEYA